MAPKLLPVDLPHPAWCDPHKCDQDREFGTVCHFSDLWVVKTATGEAIGVQLSRGDTRDGPNTGQPTKVDLLAYPNGQGAAATISVSLDTNAAREHVHLLLDAITAAESSS